MGCLLQGLSFWFLGPQKSLKQKNHVTLLIFVTYPLRVDQLCSVAYAKGYLPLKYEQDLNHSIQKYF